MPTFRDDLHLGHSVPMVDTEDIVDGAVTEPKLADDSVSTRTIQDGAVTEPKIAEKAVTEPKLADAAVSTRTIKFRAVTESKIGDSAVSTRTIQNGAVTNPKIANGAVSMNKLDNDVQTKIQQGTQRAWTPKGTYNEDTVYGVNDLVYYTDTNSSYISLQANNQGHNPAWQSATDGWWMKVVDGSYVNVMVEELEQAIAQAIEDAQEDISELISDSQATIDAAVSGANTAAQNATDAAGAATTAKNTLVEEISQSLAVYETVADTIVTDPEAATGMLPVQNYVLGRAIDPLNKAADYIKGDVRTLAVGQVYALDEAVKTADGNMLRMTRDVKAMNTTDAVATGDLKAANSKTYKALYPISAYSSSADYSSHPYAVGRPSVCTITVDVSGFVQAGEISLAIGDVTPDNIQVTTDSTAASIAADIVEAVGSIEGWTITDNEDGTITIQCNTAGANTLAFSYTDVDETGVVVSAASVAGANTISKYANGAWSAASVADMYGDSSLYEEVSIATLTSTYTSQNSVTKDISSSYNKIQNEISESETYLVNVPYTSAGKGVTYQGNISSSGSRTAPILVKAGERLVAKYTGNPANSLLAAISVTNAEGTTFTPYSLLHSGSLNSYIYSYTNKTENDVYVNVSYTGSVTLKIYKEYKKPSSYISNRVENIQKDLYGKKNVDYDCKYGYYYNRTSVTTNSNTTYGYTTDITLLAGETLHIDCAGGNPSYLYRRSGSSVTSLVNMSTTKTVDYTAGTDTVLFYSGGKISNIYISYKSDFIKSEKDETLRELFYYPYYKTLPQWINNGTPTPTNSMTRTTPIKLLRGQGLHYYIKGGGTSALWKTNEEGTVFSSIDSIVTSATAAHWRYYEASSNCYVVVQSAVSVPISLAIDYPTTLNENIGKNTDRVLDLSPNNNLANPLFQTVSSYNSSHPSAQLPQEQIITSENNYHRGPTAIVTNSSTYLVVATKMLTIEDNARQGLCLARKVSGGSWTYTDLIEIPSSGYYGNPCLVVDRTGSHGTEGRIFCFYFHNTTSTVTINTSPSNVDCCFKYSDDDGVTWSDEVSIKSAWDSSQYVFSIPSPSTGIQMSNGRLVVPAMLKSYDGFWHSGIIYKNTNGDWTFSPPTFRYGESECTCFENAGGSLILNCRFDNYGYADKNSESTLIKRNKVYSYDFTNNKWIESYCSFMTRTPVESSICRVSSGLYLRTWVDPYKNGDDPNTRERLTLYASNDGNRWIRVIRFKDGNRNGIHKETSATFSRGYTCVAYYNSKIIVAYEDNDHAIGFVDMSNALSLIQTSVTYILPMNTETRLQYLVEKLLLGYSYF